MRQFVVIKFRPTDDRAYTYHNDGEPLAAGQTARIESKSGEGWQLVYVAEAWFPDGEKPQPDFATKPILPADRIDQIMLDDAPELNARQNDPDWEFASASEDERARLASKAGKALKYREAAG